jgi:hypothetical protein
MVVQFCATPLMNSGNEDWPPTTPSAQGKEEIKVYSLRASME